jgi:very-short-patch-repair endonuclease
MQIGRKGLDTCQFAFFMQIIQADVACNSMKGNLRGLRLRFRDQHGVVSRPQLRALGVTVKVESARVASGEWNRPAASVVRLTSVPETSEQRLVIALLLGGPASIASHQSAAWLWDLAAPPGRHAITVPRAVDGQIDGVDVHRLKDIPDQISFRRKIPCTNPLRTLVDLAGVVSADGLDDAVDRALAGKLVTLAGIEAEMARLSRRGRNGIGAMRAALKRRGMVGAPNPSVLESRVLRLLAQGGITPVRVEVKIGDDGRYRVDTELVEGVLMEVDGHRHHSTPEQKAYDEQRRNELRLKGYLLLVYDWLAVTRDGRRVLAECHQAIASRRPPPPARPGPTPAGGSPARRRG